MPKNKKNKDAKKETGTHKGAVKEQHLNEPSRVGSSVGGHNEKDTAEPYVDAKRYASITGDTTPPRQEIGEKA